MLGKGWFKVQDCAVLSGMNITYQDLVAFGQLPGVNVLYPDGPRLVSALTILGYAQDSFYNNADYYTCKVCGERQDDNACLHDEDEGWSPAYNDPNTQRPMTLDEAIEWLTDTGEMTFAA